MHGLYFLLLLDKLQKCFYAAAGPTFAAPLEAFANYRNIWPMQVCFIGVTLDDVHLNRPNSFS